MAKKKAKFFVVYAVVYSSYSDLEVLQPLYATHKKAIKRRDKERKNFPIGAEYLDVEEYEVKL